MGRPSRGIEFKKVIACSIQLSNGELNKDRTRRPAADDGRNEALLTVRFWTQG
jgi:hypothetical protein